MKPLILIISITVVLFVQIWVTFGARSREFDLYTDFMLAREGFKDTVSCVGNSFISMGRVVSYSWLRTGRHLFNFHFALNYKDAEYFFYQEQKSRDKKVRLLKDGRLRRIKYFGRTFKSGKQNGRNTRPYNFAFIISPNSLYLQAKRLNTTNITVRIKILRNSSITVTGLWKMNI